MSASRVSDSWPDSPGGMTRREALERMRELERCPVGGVAVEHDALYALVTYGDGLADAQQYPGSWLNPTDDHRAVLTWLAMQALGVVRLPWHADRGQSCAPAHRCHDAHHSAWAQAWLARLADPIEREGVLAQLRDLHQHTVGRLRALGLPWVPLMRGVDDGGRISGHGGLSDMPYATALAKGHAAARSLGHRELAIPVDVISSWSLGGYPRPVTMRAWVRAEDVAWAFWALRSRAPGAPPAFEPGEWVVLNRAPRGVMAIGVDDIQHRLVDIRPPGDTGRAQQLLDELANTASTVSTLYRPELHRGRSRWTWRARVAGSVGLLLRGHL